MNRPVIPGTQEVASLVDLLLINDVTRACSFIDQIATIFRLDRHTVLNDFLAPAARRLGVLWDKDICSFVEVSESVLLLNQIIRKSLPGVIGMTSPSYSPSACC
jgi:hypothetical protein